MSRSARTPPRRRAGLTLVETLLAVALSAVILVLLASSYHAMQRTLRSRAARAEDAEALGALDRLAGELCATFPLSGRDPPFRLRAESNSVELAFAAALRPPDEPDPDRYEVEELTWRAAPEAPGGLLRLERIRAERVAPGAEPTTVTNLVARGLDAFEVRLLEGGRWVDAWPAPGGPAFPAAARLRLAVGPAARTREWTVETEVPAGVAVEPLRGKLQPDGRRRTPRSAH